VILRQDGDDVGVHNRESRGVHQRDTGRGPSLRRARIKIANSSAPSGSSSVSAFRSSRETGGRSTTPSGSVTRFPPGSLNSVSCPIPSIRLAQELRVNQPRHAGMEARRPGKEASRRASAPRARVCAASTPGIRHCYSMTGLSYRQPAAGHARATKKRYKASSLFVRLLI